MCTLYHPYNHFLSLSDPRITTVPEKHNLVHLAVTTGGTDSEFKKVIQKIKENSRYVDTMELIHESSVFSCLK